MRYEIVRNMSKGPQDALANYERYPEQPSPGFLTAADALWWLEDRGLDGSWYLRPVEDAK